ncbi:EAL and HDOD domain-containing protein [Salibacterium sp. K-3]
MTCSMARQPIVTSDQAIYGYELLYRGSPGEDFLKENPDQATSSVAFQSFLDIGLDTVTDRHTAFINFTENSLLQRVPLLLPASKITVEILEDIKGSDEMIEAVRELKNKGYRIALDDFLLNSSNTKFLPYADIVKVDWRKSSTADIQRITEAWRQHDFRLLAEKVETAGEFEDAKSMGFSLFQGYYFGCPLLIT